MLKEQRSTSYIVAALIVMGYIFYRSTFIQTAYVLPAVMQSLFQSQPFTALFSTFTFQYGEQLISLQALGYFGFVAFFGNKIWLFITYFILAYLWFIGLSGRIRGRLIPGLVSWLLAVSYAAADEFHQTLTSPVFALKEDVILAGISISLAIFVSWMLTNSKKTRN